MRILIIQETDWVLRGPHTHHHILGRLDKNFYDIRIIDFPLIWEKEKRSYYPLIRGFHNFQTDYKISTDFVKIYRSAFINLPLFNILSIFLQRRVIKELIKDFKPHFVICFASLLNVNYINKICKKNKIFFLYFIFEKYYTLVPIRILRKYSKLKMEKALINSDFNIALTKFYKDYLDNTTGIQEKNIYLPQGVDLSHFNNNLKSDRIREKYGISTKDMILFFMGWIYPFSGMKEVALKLAELNNRNIKLMIVGEGGLYDYLKQFVDKNNIKDKIILTGWVPYDELPEYISVANFCLLPAYNNNVMNDIVPIKVYEYLAMKKPVIATKLPGILREFGENNGILYIDNPKQVIDIAIINLIRADEIGQKGRSFVENLDWKIITEKFEKILKKILINNNNSKASSI